MKAAAALVALAAVAVLAASAGAVPDSERQARSDYLLHCAGCHGLEGVSRPARIPALRAEAGALLCTAEGRAYAIRLPNVAFARVGDDARLAALMNYVMFTLGGASMNAARYSPEEIAALRRDALTGGGLDAVRQGVWARIRRSCPAEAK